MSEGLDPMLIETLRTMAREGRRPSEMFTAVKGRLGSACHIVDIIRYFRSAFGFSLAEASPLAQVSGYPGNAGREVLDEPLLDSHLRPAIEAHAPEWDTAPGRS
jgi:hypothetical protein